MATTSMSESLRLEDVRVDRVGDDAAIRGRVPQAVAVRSAGFAQSE